MALEPTDETLESLPNYEALYALWSFPLRSAGKPASKQAFNEQVRGLIADYDEDVARSLTDESIASLIQGK